MNIRDLVNKEKLRCDDIVSVSLILYLIVMFLFFRLIIFVSLMIYPIFSLFIYGFFYVYKGMAKKDKTVSISVLRVILGIACIAFSSFIISLIFSHDNITLYYIIYFISLPTIFIGLAAILKGSIVRVYAPSYRKLNVLFGLLTITLTLLILNFLGSYFIFSLISLLVLLTLNGLLRSGLYLSEYGLSIRNLKNIRLVFYIMDNLQIINPEEEEVQS